MKTPPAASIRLGASVVYRAVVVLLAIFTIAAYAIFYWPTGYILINFGTPAVLMGLCGIAAIAWAVWDAWRPHRGALHYAAGEWVLAQGDVESQGTIRVEIDLQNYLLVRFTQRGHQPHTHPQWLHLESRHGQDWLALRRALFAAPPLASDSNMNAPTDALTGAPELKPL